MFLYFDLGNVILKFDHQLACRQMGEVAGIPAELVWKTVFESGLELRYEAGEVDSQQFYEEFCQATQTRPDFDRLLHAGSEIFELNASLVPVIGQLDAAGYRMGILSNTCPGHWDYVTTGRYALLRQAFDVFLLSYEVGCCKPDPRIYKAAAEFAGVRPQDIFYTDDILGHIVAAREAGFDAVQYTSTPELVAELHKRGVRFNY